MENATKALIIAGAILIAILLITIAVLIINQGRTVTDTSKQSMKTKEIQTFNAQFTPYEGKKKGAELRELYNLVAATNAAYGTEVAIGPLSPNDLIPTHVYKVKLVYAPKPGTATYPTDCHGGSTTTTVSCGPQGQVCAILIEE